MPSNGSVNRYSWAIGMIGTFTPASLPISGANMPPALTPTSAHRHGGQGPGAAQLSQETGGMERRTRRELRAFDEHDVGPPPLGEVIGDARAADPSADHHDAGVVRHPSSASSDVSPRRLAYPGGLAR